MVWLILSIFINLIELNDFINIIVNINVFKYSILTKYFKLILDDDVENLVEPQRDVNIFGEIVVYWPFLLKYNFFKIYVIYI